MLLKPNYLGPKKIKRRKEEGEDRGGEECDEEEK